MPRQFDGLAVRVVGVVQLGSTDQAQVVGDKPRHPDDLVMFHMGKTRQHRGPTLREHLAQLRQQVLNECAQPGASVTNVACQRI